jgi:hypothetical protein
MAGFLAWAAAVPAYAQSCPMCYNAAASTKASAIQALRSGTLILIFPVLFLFVGILAIAFRSRNRFNEAAAGPGMNLPGSAADDSGDWARFTELQGLPANGELASRENEVSEYTVP